MGARRGRGWGTPLESRQEKQVPHPTIGEPAFGG